MMLAEYILLKRSYKYSFLGVANDGVSYDSVFSVKVSIELSQQFNQKS